MNRVFTVAAWVLAMALCAGIDIAHAQTASGDQLQVTTQARPHQDMTNPPRPLFRLFGVPVAINSPVAPPYTQSAYSNFAGQPATGQETLALTAPYGGLQP